MLYLRVVATEEFFTVIDEQIVGLGQQSDLPDEFLSAVPRQLDEVLGTSTLAIGGWDNSTEGPLVLALASSGQIVSVVAVNPVQLATLGDTLASIDYWLSSMTLPNLSELSGNTVEFYEGLLDLSPSSSIVLSPRRRFVLITAIEDLDTSEYEARLPDADIDVHYLDVLRAQGGPALIRRRANTPVASEMAEPSVQVVETVTAPRAVPVLVEEHTEIEHTDFEDTDVEDTDSEQTDVEDTDSEYTDFEDTGVQHAADADDLVVVDDVAAPPIIDFAEVTEVQVAPVLEPDEVSVLQPVDLGIDTPETDAPAVDAPTIDAAFAVPEFGDDPDDITFPEVAHHPMEQLGVAEPFSVAPVTAEVIDLAEDETVPIDLTDQVELPTFDYPLPSRVPGGTYDLDVLPLLFDATGATLESISNELFAVNNAIVIVATLPERRRDTPFEDRRRFRWDTSLERIQLLNDNGFTTSGDRRAVHLFVETERQPGYAVYIGELNRTAFQTQTQIDGETAWFSIAPELSSDLYKLLRKGRLPQHVTV